MLRTSPQKRLEIVQAITSTVRTNPDAAQTWSLEDLASATKLTVEQILTLIEDGYKVHPTNGLQEQASQEGTTLYLSATDHDDLDSIPPRIHRIRSWSVHNGTTSTHVVVILDRSENCEAQLQIHDRNLEPEQRVFARIPLPIENSPTRWTGIEANSKNTLNAEMRLLHEIYKTLLEGHFTTLDRVAQFLDVSKEEILGAITKLFYSYKGDGEAQHLCINLGRHGDRTCNAFSISVYPSDESRSSDPRSTIFMSSHVGEDDPTPMMRAILVPIIQPKTLGSAHLANPRPQLRFQNMESGAGRVTYCSLDLPLNFDVPTSRD